MTCCDTPIDRETLLKAARNARRAGKISLGEFLAIRHRSNDDAFLADASDLICEEACADNLLKMNSAGAFGAIDWNALLAFIEKLIPLILQLIKLFNP